MKAERRHELKTNTLARGLEQLPEAGRQHGTKILVAVLGVLLLAFVIRQWRTSSREKATAAAYALNDVRFAMDQLENSVEMAMFNPQGLATVRQEVARRADDDIRRVLETADDPRLLAEAKLARGDLNWKLANFPDPPGAATQPALQFPRSRADLLKAAAQSYQEVLDDPGSPNESKRTARFGLAAVYENQRDWDKAKEQYQKLVNDADTPQPFKDQAVERLNAMDTIRKPIVAGTPATAEIAPSTSPTTTTAPSATQTTTTPSTGPMTAPPSKPATAPK